MTCTFGGESGSHVPSLDAHTLSVLAEQDFPLYGNQFLNLLWRWLVLVCSSVQQEKGACSRLTPGHEAEAPLLTTFRWKDLVPDDDARGLRLQASIALTEENKKTQD